MNELSSEEKMSVFHKYLETFLENFHKAKRGGIHDIIEISMFKMINNAIDSIDAYLEDGHKKVCGNEIITLTYESFQKTLDALKKNLDKAREINFE